MKSNRQLDKSSNPEEEMIMSGFREGDKESFRWVYDQMSSPLTYFAKNITHSQDDADDIVANAFYKLFHARARMKSYEHVKRWLYVIVRNESVDYLRLKVKQRESRHHLSYLETGIDEQIETERVKAVLFQNILEEIEKLPKQRKAILRLYFFDQKSTSEIAELMQLNSQTVLNHKAKALESLRERGVKLKWLTASALTAILINAFFLFK